MPEPPISCERYARAQRRIARRLQNEPQAARDIIRAFRGVGKSYIAAAYVIWRLIRNPRDEKILVVSATGNKSKEFVSQVKTIIATWEFLSFLRPREDERNQADRFDVAGASIAQSHSLKAVGITGQITGSRATLIVADDVEIEGNSKTEEARQRTLRTVSEFEAIVLPGADVVYLGTLPAGHDDGYRAGGQGHEGRGDRGRDRGLHRRLQSADLPGHAG
jgi:hypothetical protein